MGAKGSQHNESDSKAVLRWDFNVELFKPVLLERAGTAGVRGFH